METEIPTRMSHTSAESDARTENGDGAYKLLALAIPDHVNDEKVGHRNTQNLEKRIEQLETSLHEVNEEKRTLERHLRESKESSDKTLVSELRMKSEEAEGMREDYVKKIEKDQKTIRDFKSKVTNLEKEKMQLESRLREEITSRTCGSTIRECFVKCCWLRK